MGLHLCGRHRGVLLKSGRLSRVPPLREQEKTVSRIVVVRIEGACRRLGFRFGDLRAVNCLLWLGCRSDKGRLLLRLGLLALSGSSAERSPVEVDGARGCTRAPCELGEDSL